MSRASRPRPTAGLTPDEMAALVPHGRYGARPIPSGLTVPEAEIVQQLHDVVFLLARQHTSHPRGWYVWLGALLLGSVLGSGLGWYAAGCGQRAIQAQAQLMGQVDALLRARYTSLPPALQDALQALYTRAGFQPVGQRKP